MRSAPPDTFSYTDEDDPRQGDDYSVRVRQANDAFAWSSPVWIGGYRRGEVDAPQGPTIAW